MARFEYSSLFGELIKEVQLRFDAASRHNVELFDVPVFNQYLDWDAPTVGLDFEELIGKYNVSVAAATIGERSKEPILGSQGVETIKERVLNHAMTLAMDVATYRRTLALLDSKSISNAQKKKQLVDLMWGNVQTVVNAVNAKLDMIFLGGLSNGGVFTLDATNNPEGGVRGTINYNQPEAQIATANVEWTDGNKANAKPLEDLIQLIESASNTTEVGSILMSQSRLSYLTQSANAKQIVGGSTTSYGYLGLEGINGWLQANGLPKITVIRRKCNVQANGVITPVTPWNDKNIVLVPSGKLGTVKCAYSDNELKPEAGVTYSNYGRIRVSQWAVGETQAARHSEFTKAETFALPVITEMPNIWTLKTAL